jgi:hypothetical protein
MELFRFYTQLGLIFHYKIKCIADSIRQPADGISMKF